MIVLDTNVVSEVMRASPAPFVPPGTDVKAEPSQISPVLLQISRGVRPEDGRFVQRARFRFCRIDLFQYSRRFAPASMPPVRGVRCRRGHGGASAVCTAGFQTRPTKYTDELREVLPPAARI